MRTIVSSKRLAAYGFVLIFYLFVNPATAQVVVNEVFPPETVELKNLGTDSVDVSTYWLCNFPSYEQISNLNIECGRLNMGPGELLTIKGFNNLSEDSEMGLYTNSNFGSPVGLIDYVEWGSTGHQRSSVAVAAGVWTTGAFVDSIPSGSSIEYDGEGDAASDWLITSTTSVCANNSNASTCGTVSGGSLTPLTSTDVCAGDGIADPVNVQLSGNFGDSSSWVITDDAGNILDLPTTPPFDFEGAGGGICLIWYLSYQDGLMGLAVGQNTSNLDGCFDFSDSVQVTRTAINGGTIATSDPTTICAGNGIADMIDVTLTGEIGTNTAWIITNGNGIILDLPASPPFNLDGAGGGLCRIYNISYEDGLTGLEAGGKLDDLGGACFGLSNSIDVTRNGVSGGEITALDPTTFCAGDGNPDTLGILIVGEVGANSSLVITDTSGNILGLPATLPLDFEGAGPGVCLVWNISYEDGLTGLAMGQNTSNLDGCFDFSNPVTVIRYSGNTDGGQITTTSSGFTCAGDGIDDFVDVSLSGNTGTNSAWVITDQDGIILDLPAAPPFNFEGAGTGLCLIWHLAYENGLEGLTIGLDANELRGCFDLSNAIAITRNTAEGGQISTTSNTDICVGEGVDNLIDATLSGNVGGNSAWVITDTSGTILGLPAAPPFNLENAGTGICLIWHLSYADGLTGLMMGANTSDLDGCFDFSNSISVTRTEVNGGNISTTDPTTICAGDGVADPINVTLSDNIGSNSGWVITDASGLILGLPSGSPFDLEGAGTGTCLILHISYEEGLTGLTMGQNTSGLSGCFSLSNSIAVNRMGVDGGTISTDDPTTICAGDGTPDPIDVTLMGNEGSNSGWIITDTSGTILGLPAAPPFDLEGAGTGICLIWHISYTNGLTGLTMGQNTSGLSGCFSLSNPIRVDRLGGTTDGGTISTTDPTTICAGDGMPDPIDVSLTGNAGTNSGWIITDGDGNILGLPMAPPFDLEGAGGGLCLIWHISYEDGLIGLTMGQNTSGLQGCFSLSNSIAVTRNGVEGGQIATTDPTTICAGDGVGDPIDVTLTGNSGDNSGWVITDTTGTILGLPMAPPFDLEGAGGGICLIWHISYADGLSGLTMGQNTSDLMGCFEFSNPITVVRNGVNGGQITTTDPTTICAGDGDPDPIEVSLSANEGANSAWVITDNTGTILGLPMAPPFDLEGAGAGVCLIWHLSYEDGLTGLMMGENTSGLMGCFDFSNPITVVRNGVNGGEISTMDPTFICAGDGVDDPIDVSLTGAEGDSSGWIITDTVGTILGLPTAPPFNLEGAGAGVCLIWHISYNGDLMGATLDSNTMNLVGCYDLSNPITVVRSSGMTEGGTISTTDPTDICAGDGVGDPIDVSLTGNISTNSAWVITDNAGLILGLPMAPPFDLDEAGAGVCLIWHLSYEDGLMGLAMGQNANDLIGCFDLSNPITVNRTEINGGQITTSDPTTICAGDGIGDPIDVSLSDNIGSNSAWVITDTSGTILGLPMAPPFDLEGAGGGICLIWHLSYEDGLMGLMMGENANDLSGSCFHLSNPITVVRNGVNGGEISTTDPTTICAGDGVGDPIDVTLMGAEGDSTAWIITDTAGLILGLPMAPPFDLEGAGAGVCLIWHLSYHDAISGLMMGQNANDLSGCFDLSNPITVIRNGVEAGTITTTDPTTICAGDGQDDLIDVTLTGATGDSSAWVITDTLGVILGLPAAPPFNFEGAGGGVCLIWHISYTGDLVGAALDSNANNLIGCFALSDPIVVTRVTSGPDCVTSTFDVNPSSIQFDLSPNPAKEQLFVDLRLEDIKAEKTSIRITTAAGQLVQTYEYQSVDRLQVNLDIEAIPSGLYLISVQNDRRILTKRFVKE